MRLLNIQLFKIYEAGIYEIETMQVIKSDPYEENRFYIPSIRQVTGYPKHTDWIEVNGPGKLEIKNGKIHQFHPEGKTEFQKVVENAKPEDTIKVFSDKILTLGGWVNFKPTDTLKDYQEIINKIVHDGILFGTGVATIEASKAGIQVSERDYGTFYLNNSNINFIDPNLDGVEPTQEEIKFGCTCGAHSVGSGSHSSWCDVNDLPF